MNWVHLTKVISISFSTLQNNKWIYNCLHVGFNFQDRILEVPIYQCCQQCKFPAFSRCMRKYSGAVAQPRCNGDAIRCIARCINKKSPTAGRPGPTGGRPGPPGPGPKKCPVKHKRVGGSYCLERSCIHVWKSNWSVGHYEVRPKIWSKSC
jgi:hypothetical protein